MNAIIIGDGLTLENLSLDHPHRGSRSNVGRREIERLMGAGRVYGAGPLPTFLRLAAETEVGAPRAHVILLRGTEQDEDGEPVAAAPEHGTEFVDPISGLAHESTLVSAPSDAIPADELTRAFAEVDLSSPGWEDAHFLIVGCHTERRILGIASFLKNVLGCANVAVCSHLVGSATQEAHFAALRHTLPSAGIEVLLDLEEAATYCGLEPADFAEFDCQPCTIEPEEVRNELDDSEKRIVELLCMHWTRARLRPLAGGFSGSLLFLADGWKGSARTEPLVVKIDDFAQMRRELNGYHQVKDFFGKHVPTFGYPIVGGDSIGVGMDLAAMEGRPQTMQDSFEEAEGEAGLSRFLHRTDRALALLSEKLYANTENRSWVAPYRAFGLHTERQVRWMLDNSKLALTYLEDTGSEQPLVNPEQIAKLLRIVASNEDGLTSEVCLTHGDLNFANVICDDGDNIWFIDWTHSGQAPVELDFAKLENDAKFVMSKEFDVDDLGRLRRLEEYFLSHRIPAEAGSLPEELKFVKWDLRFRKILDAVRRIRETCFGLRADDDWLVYRIALLKYALHTLSFDKRRDRGECDLPQLMHALYSVEALVFDLVSDDFHLKIRAERPSSYPSRQRISIDEAPWLLDCDGYDPPYHVDPAVLENDRTQVEAGWADPEDVSLIADDLGGLDARFRDDEGRPLNPHGRTGIAGRGLLGYWGPNLSVAATVTRANPDTGETEILLGSTNGRPDLALPKGFVLREERPEAAVGRVLEHELGWRGGASEIETVFEGFTYDRRQTDHAWVETRAFLLHGGADGRSGGFEPGGEFDEVRWRPLDADTVNRVPSDQARFIRESITRLVETGVVDRSDGESLLERTG